MGLYKGTAVSVATALVLGATLVVAWEPDPDELLPNEPDLMQPGEPEAIRSRHLAPALVALRAIGAGLCRDRRAEARVRNGL
jgi:hypothetical protein